MRTFRAFFRRFRGGARGFHGKKMTYPLKGGAETRLMTALNELNETGLGMKFLNPLST